MIVGMEVNVSAPLIEPIGVEPAAGPADRRQNVFPPHVWIVFSAVVCGAAGCTGDVIWSKSVAIMCAVLGTVLGAVYGFVRHEQMAAKQHTLRSFILRAVILGLGLGLTEWLLGLGAWLALQIGFGGRFKAWVLTLLGVAGGAGLGWVIAWCMRYRSDRQAERRRRLLLTGAAMVALALDVTFLLMTGPRNLTQYPDHRTSPYRLPWKAGVTHLCVQGNRAVVSHRGWEEFAYDFAMPVGTDVCAARGGIVTFIDVSNDGHGPDAMNNYIMVRHDDGTFGQYLHLRQGGSYVRRGQRVRQGERLGASGNVGRSMLPHLHFQVIGMDKQLRPVTFADVDTDDGIPRMFKRYTSGNTGERQP